MLRVDVTQQRWFSGEGIAVRAVLPVALERSLGIPKMDERYQCVLKLDDKFQGCSLLFPPASLGTTRRSLSLGIAIAGSFDLRCPWDR